MSGVPIDEIETITIFFPWRLCSNGFNTLLRWADMRFLACLVFMPLIVFALDFTKSRPYVASLNKKKKSGNEGYLHSAHSAKNLNSVSWFFLAVAFARRHGNKSHVMSALVYRNTNVSSKSRQTHCLQPFRIAAEMKSSTTNWIMNANSVAASSGSMKFTDECAKSNLFHEGFFTYSNSNANLIFLFFALSSWRWHHHLLA